MYCIFTEQCFISKQLLKDYLNITFSFKSLSCCYSLILYNCCVLRTYHIKLITKSLGLLPHKHPKSRTNRA